ncbi:unnamed protein product [Rangifer tarandus platyrhynchus]|uniref:Uncharacterized protein n=2 Tax=Rangifer tarandus platyrhynchus TaxID=3082113 RepID=A0AC59YMN1_RANTA|nr:unnamed protein product [Rangifer tarandus platyrhynchus]
MHRWFRTKVALQESGKTGSGTITYPYGIFDLRVKNDFLKYQDRQPKMKRQIRLIEIKIYHYEWKGKPQNGRRYLPHLKLVNDSYLVYIKNSRDFPGGPVVKTSLSNAGGVGSMVPWLGS